MIRNRDNNETVDPTINTAEWNKKNLDSKIMVHSFERNETLQKSKR